MTDIQRILAAQAVRALMYGFGAVLLGVTLDERGWSGTEVGVLLTAIVAGTALMSFLVGTYGDRVGRRRWYAGLFAGLALAGVGFALIDQLWLLSLIGLTGTISTEVIESGPFTSLEQSMLAASAPSSERTRLFSTYNGVAAVAGSVGALLAGGPALLRNAWGGAPHDERFFIVFVPAAAIGGLLALSLSDRVEVEHRERRARPLRESRGTVTRLAALFAVDSFAGGFVIQSFIAYWFHVKFGLSIEALGALFFGVGIMQAASFFAAARIAERFGLLNTMVFTHIPSNVLLAAIPLAPSLPIAIALLLGRQALSQMDVPTRQAYIANLVRADERTAAAAYTSTARYVVRPVGPLLAGVTQQLALGLPFFIGGGLKIAYDLTLWNWFRNVPLHDEDAAASRPGDIDSPQRHRDTEVE